jgi:succinate dehydrogenase/fumarate reductase cytochrome b subunit
LIIIGGLFPQLTYALSDFFHTGYPPAIVFALAIIASYVIVFHCFQALSVLTIENKELASQTALLDQRVQELEKTITCLQQDKDEGDTTK